MPSMSRKGMQSRARFSPSKLSKRCWRDYVYRMLLSTKLAVEKGFLNILRGSCSRSSRALQCSCRESCVLACVGRVGTSRLANSQQTKLKLTLLVVFLAVLTEMRHNASTGSLI